MLFVNILMLFGLGAVAIPVIIQLLTRRNLRDVPWGAWLFLDKTVKKRKRKVILEDILLIACRCLALALLALAFARPFVRPDAAIPWAVTLPTLVLSVLAFGASFALWRHKLARRLLLGAGVVLLVLVIASIVFERRLNLNRLGRDATKDVVLLVDASASMSVVTEGKTNLDRALEEAREYVKSAPPDTCFSVVIGGPVPMVLNEVPVSDRRIVYNALDSVAKRFSDGKLQGTMQVGGCLTAAGVILQAGHNPVKQIVVVGDGQTLGWNIDDAGRWRTIRRMFEALEVDPQIVWRTLSLPTSVRNLTVASVKPIRSVVGTDREVLFEATVVNRGGEPVTPSGVTFVAGAKTLRQAETAPIQPGESRVYTFRHRFLEPGAATVTAKVECEDDIPADNTCEYAMPVLDTLKVLIVSGDGRSAVGKGGSAAFINLALRPELVRAAAEAGATAKRDYLIETVVEDVTAVAQRRSFVEFSAVIVSGVRWLPEPTLASLAGFAHGGGGVWFLPGTGSDPEAFAKWNHEGASVLPAPLGAWRSNEAAIDPSGFGATLMRFRNGNDLGTATPVSVMRFGDGWQPETETLAALTDGTPVLLSRRFGSGLIVESAMPFDELSGLVYKHGFLPMVHEIVYALARPTAVSLDVRPSEGLTLCLGKSPSTNGLLADYYPTFDRKTAKPVLRLDENINFNWGDASPLPGSDFPADRFSVRWRGVLTPPETGSYRFAFEVDDRLTVRIGTQSVRSWGSVKLEGGKSYPFEATYEEDTGPAYVRFKWSLPKEKNFSIVPTSVFRAQIAGSEGAGELVQVEDPHGESFAGEIYQAGEALYLHLTRSVSPGRYTVTDIPDQIRPWIANVLTSDGKLFFTVSSDANESDMTAVNSEQIAALNEYVRILQALKPEDVVEEIAGQGFGKELWRLLAGIVFLLLVLEPAIARWIAVNRRTGDVIDTEGSWIRT